MDNQVTQLKQRVKALQRQLCDRTRNYLYHFKKSPIKKTHLSIDQQTQTQSTDQLIQDTTQTQNPQQNHFANVTLENFNHKYEISNSPQSVNEQKTEIGLTIDLNNDKFDNQLRLENEKHRYEIDTLALEIRLMKEQLEKSKTPRNKHEMKFEFLPIPSKNQQKTPSKQQNSNDPSRSNNMQFSKKKQCQTIEQESFSDLKSMAQSSYQKTVQHDHLSKEIKIMKKEIKKLKSHLQNEVHASKQTKEALLISQEQNYKFRLKIQRLNKEIQILTGASTDSEVDRYEKPLVFEAEEPALSSIDSEKSDSTKEELEKFKSQVEKYEEHIFILQGVKRDYLKKCIQAKEEIYHLKQEKQKLKEQLNTLTLATQPFRHQEALKKQTSQLSTTSKNQFLPQSYSTLTNKELQAQWTELFKSKIHQISNCLPVDDNQEMFLFRPETVEDLISMLERILVFCKNIETWEKNKIMAIEKERANLLRIMSGMLVRHPQTKQALAEEILQIEELKYLVNFLNKEPKGSNNNIEGKFNKIFLTFDNATQISQAQSEPIQTN